MARYKNILTLLSIALAVIVPLVTAVKARSDQISWPVVKIEIEPYDPRDLLYGHYMNFAYTWNLDTQQKEKACQGAHCCLCLGAGVEDPKASVIACLPEKPAHCTHVLEGSYYGERFDLGELNRYYVDESVAMPLENMFRNKKQKFHVGLAISPTGKPVLEKLYVGGQAVDEYVQQHYEELTKPAAEDTLGVP